MFIAVVYVIGKMVISSNEHSDKERNSILHKSDIELRLAYRKIYRSTTDINIQNLVKKQYGAWFLLFLELDDAQYTKKMETGDAWKEFGQAVQNVKERGDALRLVDGKILSRSSQ